MKSLLKVLTSVWTRVILFALAFGGLCYAYGINVGLKGAYYMYLQAGNQLTAEAILQKMSEQDYVIFSLLLYLIVVCLIEIIRKIRHRKNRKEVKK